MHTSSRLHTQHDNYFRHASYNGRGPCAPCDIFADIALAEQYDCMGSFDPSDHPPVALMKVMFATAFARAASMRKLVQKDARSTLGDSFVPFLAPQLSTIFPSTCLGRAA